MWKRAKCACDALWWSVRSYLKRRWLAWHVLDEARWPSPSWVGSGHVIGDSWLVDDQSWAKYEVGDFGAIIASKDMLRQHFHKTEHTFSSLLTVTNDHKSCTKWPEAHTLGSNKMTQTPTCSEKKNIFVLNKCVILHNEYYIHNC